MTAPASCLEFNPAQLRLFVGLDSGGITEFAVADDYNKITMTRAFPTHQARVTQMIFSPETNWLLTVSKDRSLFIHCTETGRRLTSYQTPAPCTSLQYDFGSKTIFIGDLAGQIHMLKIDAQLVLRLMTTLKGHLSGIRCLFWDASRQLLFSGGLDNSVVCWDIGGKKGTTFELQGHK